MVIIIVLTVFIHLEQKNKIQAHENVCENHDYCYIQMPAKYKDVLKYNRRVKYLKLPFVISAVIYAGTESLLEKLDTCYNNPEK